MEMDKDKHESESLLQTETEGEKDINGAVKRKDKNTSELQCHVQDSEELPGRSERPHMPTEKMLV